MIYVYKPEQNTILLDLCHRSNHGLATVGGKTVCLLLEARLPMAIFVFLQMFLLIFIRYYHSERSQPDDIRKSINYAREVIYIHPFSIVQFPALWQLLRTLIG